MRRIFGIYVLVFCSCQLEAFTWLGVQTNWNESSSWSGSAGHYPNSANALAVFNIATSFNPDITSPVTVTQLNFEVGSGNYTLTGDTLQTDKLAGNPDPAINIEAGSQTFEVAIGLLEDTSLNISTGASLTLASDASVSGAYILTVAEEGTLYNYAPIATSEFVQVDTLIDNYATGSIAPTELLSLSGTFNNEGGTVSCATIEVTGGAVNNNSGGIFSNLPSATFILSDVEVTNGGSSEDTGVVMGESNAIQMTGGTLLNQNGANFSCNTALIENAYFEMTGTTFNNVDGATALTNTLTTLTNAIVNNTGGSALGVDTLTSAGINQFTVANSTLNNTGESMLGSVYKAFAVSGSALVNDAATFDYYSLNLTDSTLDAMGGTVGANSPSGIVIDNSTVNLTDGVLFSDNSAVALNGGALNVDPTVTTGNFTFTFTGGTLNNNGTFITTGFEMSGSDSLLTGEGTFIASGSSLYQIVNAAGTVFPGNPAGTTSMTLLNGVFKQTGGTFKVNIANGSNTELFASGATLGGALEVFAFPDLGLTGKYTLISTYGDPGVSGTFSSVSVFNLPPDTLYQVIYDPDAVTLEIAPRLINYFGNFYYMIFSNINQVNSYLFRHTDRLRENYFCDFDCAGQLVACTRCQRLNFYAVALGSLGNIGSHGAQKGLSYTTEGVMTGFDYILTCAAVGVECDYQKMHGGVRNRFGKVSDDHYHLSLYGIYAPVPELALTALVGGGGDHFKTRRVAPTGGQLRASVHGHTFDALAGIDFTISRYNFPFLIKNLFLTPMANVQYMALNVDPLQERYNPIYNGRFEKQKYQSIRSLLGVKSTCIFSVGNFSFLPALHFAWQREFYDCKRDLHFFIGGTSVNQSLEILPSGRNVYLAGLDLAAQISKFLSAGFSYQFEGSSGYVNNFLSLGLDLAF